MGVDDSTSSSIIATAEARGKEIFHHRIPFLFQVRNYYTELLVEEDDGKGMK